MITTVLCDVFEIYRYILPGLADIDSNECLYPMFQTPHTISEVCQDSDGIVKTLIRI